MDNKKRRSHTVVYPVIRAATHTQAQTTHKAFGHLGLFAIIQFNMTVNIQYRYY
jgi:hypothetical protein